MLTLALDNEVEAGPLHSSNIGVGHIDRAPKVDAEVVCVRTSVKDTSS